MDWMLAAIVLFALTAAGGATLLVLALRGKSLGRPLRMVHGLLGVTGLICLIIAAAMGATATLVLASLACFALAAIGGGSMWVLSALGKRPPLPLMIGHGTIAVAGFVLLLLAYFGSTDPGPLFSAG